MSDPLPPEQLTSSVPANETERLAALRRYKILDTPPEVGFDRITQLAARLFDVPTALISLVDESRAWFKSCVGFGASEVPRDATLCNFAVLANEPLIVADARLDDRFACNRFVQAEPGVRFYAGAPLISRDGFNLGTLCLLDSQPRDLLTSDQQATLVDLAAMVVDELELRLAANQVAQIDAALRAITKGVATVTGEDFLKALVQHFAQILEVDYAFIGLMKGDDPKMLQTIATCAYGQIVENLEYPLQGTPCWNVIERGKICCYPRSVQAHFPNASLLQPLSIESYGAIPFFDSKGQPSGLLGVMDGKPLENVHLVESLLTVFADRIATELERQQIEQERDRFLSVGSDLQVITGDDGYFRWVSPTFERLLGWTPAEMIARPWTEFVHPDDVPTSEQETVNLFSGNETFEFENRYRHKDGSYRWLLWRAQPKIEAQIIYGAAIDITDRKQAEVALQASEEHSRNILESITDAFFALDENWQFTYVNQAACTLLDRTLSDLMGKGLWQEFPGLPESEFEQMHRRVMRDRVAESLTAFYPDHDRWYEVRDYPATSGMTIYFKNVTEQIKAEEALRLSEARFRRIFECNVIGMGIWARTGDVLNANDALLDTIGYKRQELVEGRIDWQELTPPEQAERDQQAIAEIDLRGICSPYEKDFIHKQGHRIPVLLGGAGFTDNAEEGFFFALDLSDRKQAELEIQKFVSLADNSGEFISMCDMNFVPFYINSAGQQLVGLDSVQQYAEVSVSDFFFPEDQDFIINEFLPRVLREGRAEIEIRFRHFKTGAALWMIYNVFYISGENNQPIGLATVSRNITGRKQAEAALQQRETELRLVTDAVPALIAFVDLEQRYRFNNQGYEVWFGKPATEVYGKSLREVLGEAAYERIRPYVEQVLAGQKVTFESQIPYQNGGNRYITATYVPRLNSQGAVEGFVALINDITDRKQAEAALQKSEARYRLLAEAIPQLVWMTDAEGQNQYVNQRFCDFTGLTAEQLYGSNWLTILHPDDVAMARDCWLAAVNREQFYEIEYRFRHADGGYRWFLGQGIPLKDDQGRVSQWFGTCTDIEPQKQIEQTRLRLLEQEQSARAEAERANRLKDEFLAVLSHELRSPLNPILGWTHLLQTGKLDAVRQREALAIIERNARLQTQLIEDLLDISRIMQGKLSLTVAPVDLSFVITAAVETVRLAAEAKNIQILLDLPNVAPSILGDAARLQQVVWNLLTNAVKFTPKGGHVMVELRQVDHFAQLRVIDTGKGIEPQFLPHVFEYFRQADASTTRKFGGLGLGLAIVRQIVEMHSGTVEAESQGDNQGATFIVQLPLSDQGRSSQSEPLRNSTMAPVSLSNLHILLVDDDADTREFQAFLLEQSGARVTAVASGFEALQALDQHIPDVMVSDVGMAEMDGYMLIQQVRSRPQDQGGRVPAIALTAYARDFDQQKAFQSGFQTHLTKPVEPDVLVGAIIKLLEHS